MKSVYDDELPFYCTAKIQEKVVGNVIMLYRVAVHGNRETVPEPQFYRNDCLDAIREMNLV